MMTALYIICGIVAVLIVLALIAPKTTQAERSVVVSLPPEKVYQDVRSLQTFVKWSPWGEKDPNMENGFKGTDGEIGSLYWWRGNKEVGAGEQEVKELVPGKKVVMELRFLKPFKSEADCYFEVEPAEGGTRLTWGFQSANKLPMSIFMMFLPMEKMIGKDFEKGLNKYKVMAEQG